MLRVAELEVEYRGFRLGPIDFSLEAGEFLTLIGTNGSGKSTLIRGILGLVDISRGQVELFEEPLANRGTPILGLVGYVSDSNKDLLPEFTAMEYWNYCKLAYERARGHKLPDAMNRAVHLAEMLDFPFQQKRPLSALSLGTSRKAQIIAALLAEPELLVLDESFIGLDFIAARALETLLISLRDEGMTILASSHDLDLAARLADRVLVLHNGSAILNSSVNDIGGFAFLEDAVRSSLAAARG